MNSADDAAPSALIMVMCRALGLSTADLAEIGGFTEQHARRLMAGKSPPKADVIEALNAIRSDVDDLAETFIDTLESRGGGEIACYRSNDELRKDGAMPARGRAEGGFAGPYMVAVYYAMDEIGEGAVPVFD